MWFNEINYPLNKNYACFYIHKEPQIRQNQSKICIIWMKTGIYDIHKNLKSPKQNSKKKILPTNQNKASEKKGRFVFSLPKSRLCSVKLLITTTAAAPEHHRHDVAEAAKQPAAPLLQPPPPRLLLVTRLPRRLQIRPRRVLQQGILNRNLLPTPARRRPRKRGRIEQKVFQSGVATRPLQSNHLYIVAFVVAAAANAVVR